MTLPWRCCHKYQPQLRQFLTKVNQMKIQVHPLNNAFRGALINYTESRMIVVNRNKTNIEKRVKENFPIEK